MTTANRNSRLGLGLTLAAACLCAAVVYGNEKDAAAFQFEPDKNIIPRRRTPPRGRRSARRWPSGARKRGPS